MAAYRRVAAQQVAVAQLGLAQCLGRAKLVPSEADVLYRGEWLTVRAIRRPNRRMPAREWLDRLDSRGRGQFLAAAHAIETSLRSGRPPAGRAQQIKNSSEGIWELRVTKQGSTPPHLRAFYVRNGRTLWVATGITKKQNRLQQRDIDEADRIVAEWRSSC